jgi:hypothetical protein
VIRSVNLEVRGLGRQSFPRVPKRSPGLEEVSLEKEDVVWLIESFEMVWLERPCQFL